MKLFNSLGDTESDNMDFLSVTKEKGLAIDLFENETEYFLMVDCPGIKKEDIDLQMTENKITISVKNQFDSSQYNMSTIIRERVYKNEREILLDAKIDTDPTSVSAKYCDGVLYVSAKKAVEKSGISIRIE